MYWLGGANEMVMEGKNRTNDSKIGDEVQNGNFQAGVWLT
jgi:hypothetical protein